MIDRNGTILTNYHVIENAVKVTVSFEKGKTVEAQVVGKDPSNDLAVLRIHPDGLTLHPVTLGDSSAVQVGDPVYAIGNPFDLQRTLTTGVVSALQRQLKAPNGFTIYNVIQTDAPINPGNSGGPLLNSQGRVIGINSQIETGGTSNGSVGIGFAVPINTAKSELGKLEKGGTVSQRRLPRRDLDHDRRLAVRAEPARRPAARSSRASRRARPPRRPASRAASRPARRAARWRSAATSSSPSTAKTIAGSEDLATVIGEKKPGETVSVKLLHPERPRRLGNEDGHGHARQAPGDRAELAGSLDTPKAEQPGRRARPAPAAAARDTGRPSRRDASRARPGRAPALGAGTLGAADRPAWRCRYR